MKHFKVMISLIAIAFAFASCGDDSSSSSSNDDDPPALSGENLKVTELVDKAVGDSVNDALSSQKNKIVAKIMFVTEDGEINYSNDDGSLKITGKEMDIKIVMKEFSAEITEENGTKHTVKMSGTLTKKDTHNRESHSSVITKKGILDVTFDDTDHTIGFDYSETEDYSKMDDEGNLPYTIEGKITFDGSEYSYKKSDKKSLKN
ncbi:MAG TPA: hypothetical protein PLE16_10550 [Spirochaetota bacterium]|nr:hypothetical protein [Spirochaetota bacterium]HOH36046.1 hypothetical protein [Spirochaetota bacterium]HPM35024.1 hypothetical protein [Spirochaetota bacterium]